MMIHIGYAVTSWVVWTIVAAFSAPVTLKAMVGLAAISAVTVIVHWLACRIIGNLI